MFVSHHAKGVVCVIFDSPFFTVSLLRSCYELDSFHFLLFQLEACSDDLAHAH